MRRGIIIGAAVALAGLCGGALVVGHSLSADAKPPAAAPAVPAQPVVAATVTQGDVPIYFTGIGYVQAYNTVVIRSQIQGQLTKIVFKEGQAVRPGDLLAVIDPSPYQAQLDQATAIRDRDKAQLTNAEANLQRYLPLLAKGFATPQLVDTQKAQVAQLAAAVKSDQAVIENAKVQLGYTQMTSPIDGVTGIRQLDLGNVIHPTDLNGLVVVTQLHPISLIFTLPEQDLPRIQQEMAKGPLTVLAYSQDGKIQLDKGTLELVDNQIIQTAGSVRLKARFDNLANRLWPGELVSARLLIEMRQNGLTIPAPAVQRGPNGPYVYVIKPDQTADARPVRVQQAGDGQVLVADGLTAGEMVVLDGQSKLQPGTPVTVLQGAAAARATTESESATATASAIP